MKGDDCKYVWQKRFTVDNSIDSYTVFNCSVYNAYQWNKVTDYILYSRSLNIVY